LHFSGKQPKLLTVAALFKFSPKGIRCLLINFKM
jgi:hypothetical protein